MKLSRLCEVIAKFCDVMLRTIGLVMLLLATYLISWAILRLIRGGSWSTIKMLLCGSIPAALMGLWLISDADSWIMFPFSKKYTDKK